MSFTVPLSGSSSSLPAFFLCFQATKVSVSADTYVLSSDISYAVIASDENYIFAVILDHSAYCFLIIEIQADRLLLFERESQQSAQALLF